VAGAAPKGWMFIRIDSSAGVASAVMKIPTIVDFDESQDPCKFIKNGDWVKMNGETGQVEISRPQLGGDNPLKSLSNIGIKQECKGRG